MESINKDHWIGEESNKGEVSDRPLFKLPAKLPTASARVNTKINEIVSVSEIDTDKGKDVNIDSSNIFQDPASTCIDDTESMIEPKDKISSSDAEKCKNQGINLLKSIKHTNNQNTADQTNSSTEKHPKKVLDLSVPYKVPPWGEIAPPLTLEGESLYTIEELKNGVIVAKHPLSKSHLVIGRLPNCDIQLEHPSLSRYHAILQFKADGSADKPAGFYLYDLNSTHGTFHNKKQCFPKTFYRMRVGHVMKFGGSTRLLILQGPQEDTEAESELSVTELKELAAEKAKKRQEKEQQHQEKIELDEAKGISWGMSEDAVEEDDAIEHSASTNLHLNQFTNKLENEDLYLNDPKKSLRGWFEREGYDLEYDCKEVGYAKFKCTVILPIEDEHGVTSEVIAEATVSGKKKEAVINCALEACRILDRRGVLRSSNHESRSKRSAKKWEENDYYDSDEDEFLDRTGTLEVKRQKRMKKVKDGNNQAEEASNKINKPIIENFESLTKKHNLVSKEILSLQERIKAASLSIRQMENHTKDSQNEDLDTYMAALEKSADCSKENIAKLKIQLSTHMSESKRLERLIEIARPAKLPEKVPNSKIEKNSANERNSVQKSSAVVIGKMFGRGIGKIKAIVPSSKTNKSLINISLSNNDQELKEDVKSNCNKSEEVDLNNIPKNHPDVYETEKIKFSHNTQNEMMSSLDNKNKDIITQFKHKNVNIAPASSINTEKETSKQSMTKEYKTSTNRKAYGISNSSKEEQKHVDSKPYEELSELDERYSAWMPPKNQSGDGRTSLNDKYGY